MTSKRAYNPHDYFADYAAQQGAPVSAFTAFGWRETRYKKRRALTYPTATGPRWRYLDGAEPRHDSPAKYKASWYRLPEAIAIATATGQPLILVNGAAGTVAAQWHGLAVFAVSDGEQRAIPDTMLDELKAAWQGEIWIAQDCDLRGRESAAKRARALLDAEFIVKALDLQLGEHGDIADFCKLHQGAALAQLAALPEIPPAAPAEPRQIVEYTGDIASKREEWYRDEVLPAANASLTGKKHSLCINPAHRESHASARIGKANRAGAPLGLLYYCTCGTHNLTTVSKWLGLDFRQWLKAKYPHSSKTKRRQMAKTVHQRQTVGAQTVGQPEDDIIIARWVGDVLTPAEIARYRTLLIEAPTGMGKTTAIALFALWLASNRPDTVLTGYAQYRLLTAVLAKALDASHYEDADATHVGGLQYEKRLVNSVSSAPKIPREAGGIVIADEAEGDLQFILSSKTFLGSGAIRSWSAIKKIWGEAGQFIGMDAGLSDITIDLIRQWRGEVTVKRFRKAETRGEAILLNNPIAAIYQTGKMLLHKRGLVTVACSGEARTTDIADHFTEQGYRVKKITRDTSKTLGTHHFVTNPESRANYDLLVYDAAMGAGVSIDEPVYAHIGIFDSRPLDPEHAIQLLGRARNPHRIYIACPGDSEGYETPTEAELISERLRREYVTSELTNRDAHVGGDYLEMLQIWAKFEERSRRESAEWRRYFITRLKNNGYTVKVINGNSFKAFAAQWAEWKATRADADWQYILKDAQGNALDDEALRKLRQQRIEITREMNNRHVRFKIEDVLGHEDVTENDRDLVKPAERQKLAFLTTIYSGIKAAIAQDAEQADEGRPLQHRDYLAIRLKALNEILEAMGFTGTIEAQFNSFTAYFSEPHSTVEIYDRFNVLVSGKLDGQLKRLGHTGTNAETVTGLCRWILDRGGVKLLSEKHKRDGNRQQFYWIDSEHLDYVVSRAKCAAQEGKRKEKGVQNIEYKGNKCFGHPQVKAAKTASLPPTAPIRTPPPHNVNPFALGWKSAGAA